MFPANILSSQLWDYATQTNDCWSQITRLRQQMKDIKSGKQVPSQGAHTSHDAHTLPGEDFDEALPPAAGLPLIFTMQQKGTQSPC